MWRRNRSVLLVGQHRASVIPGERGCTDLLLQRSTGGRTIMGHHWHLWVDAWSTATWWVHISSSSNSKLSCFWSLRCLIILQTKSSNYPKLVRGTFLWSNSAHIEWHASQSLPRVELLRSSSASNASWCLSFASVSTCWSLDNFKRLERSSTFKRFKSKTLKNRIWH